MFIIGEYRGHGKTALLSRLGPLEATGPKTFELKTVTRNRFKTMDEALAFARKNGTPIDPDKPRQRDL